MANPFPGMDPYVENRVLWQGFHNRWMTYATQQLQPQLPRNYVATVEMRVFFERSLADDGGSSSRIPDLELVRTGPSPRRTEGVVRREVELSGHFLELYPVEVREAYLVVRELPSKEVVTCLELLSPTNKQPGEGRDQYRLKQTQMFASGINMVEVDLLRGGIHTVLPAAEELAELAPFHYLASVYRVTDALRCQVFTWDVRERMPVIPIPLAPEDEEVRLDLQEVFDTTYQHGAMERLLDYQSDPTPPLAAEDAAWADALLREAGLRGAPGA